MKSLIAVTMLAAFVTPANAQSTSSAPDLPNPNIVVASACSGMAFANTMNNLDVGVLTEERAKATARFLELATLLISLREENLDHMSAHSQKYTEAFDNSYRITFNNLLNDNFGWVDQEELDVCYSRMFEAVTNPPEDIIKGYGISGMFELVGMTNKDADSKFDYILGIMKASQ
ncbi:hypothetical protein ROSMUCSMR3_02928 [Roseovarius mucosus]|uniref:Uncharacterized protein n=1 Tax=Roseovarius mucosus TaxID=215743 RepID=A0A1V0RRK0_9RHOB|nr:hypothetical protein [Roseovarius mucosus]ARE84394.1 hypothetical protein ROSMUCSMR3_02928 [Roseovarius mucosus]